MKSLLVKFVDSTSMKGSYNNIKLWRVALVVYDTPCFVPQKWEHTFFFCLRKWLFFALVVQCWYCLKKRVQTREWHDEITIIWEQFFPCWDIHFVFSLFTHLRTTYFFMRHIINIWICHFCIWTQVLNVQLVDEYFPLSTRQELLLCTASRPYLRVKHMKRPFGWTILIMLLCSS